MALAGLVLGGLAFIRRRSGYAPAMATQVLSGLRDMELPVLRATGLARIAEAFRHMAAKPDDSAQKVVLPLPTNL